MDLIEQFTKLDFTTLITGIVIIGLILKGVCEFITWFISFFGIETKSMIKKKKECELLILTSKKLEALQNEQIEPIKNGLKDITEKVNEISDNLCEMKQANNITEMKKLKGKLVAYYNKFKDSEGWTEVDKEVFWDLFEDYESRGGNGYIHTIVEPVMREMKVVYN
jgi:hypothetical protein